MSDVVAARVVDGRLSLAAARGSGVDLYWSGQHGVMTGCRVVVVMDAMRGLSSVLAGCQVARDGDGYAILPHPQTADTWYLCTLTGTLGDYHLSPDGRELLWFDPSDQLGELGALEFEPETAPMLARAARRRATLQAAARQAAATAVLRQALGQAAPRPR
jgi:hypothetical protein